MTTYLAIDLGTTGCRSILYDASLRELAISYEEYPLQTPQEHWAEQDAEDWWRLTCSTAKNAIRQAGCSAAEVHALSISSQGITLVPVDTELRSLCPALTWLDVRAQEQTGQILRDFGDTAIFEHTGKHIDACYTLPKILWLREKRPEIWEKTYKLLMPMDYLLTKLTGRCVTDHSMASGTLLYDLKNACWSKRLLEHYQIPSHLLPEILWSGEAAGRILPEAAAALGVSEDCIVAAGAQDQKCAALGAGLDQDTMTVSLGTAGAVMKLWREALPERYTSVGWCGYTDPGAWVTEGVINTAGTCLRWVRDTLFPGEGYDTINREAKQAAARGSRMLFYPYLNGPSAPDYYPDAEGCFYGASLSSTRGDFALAVMRGVAFQIRIMLEAMGAYPEVTQLVLFGGGARSPLWCQCISDAAGVRVHVPSSSEAAGRGAAVLAGTAAGAWTKEAFPKDIGGNTYLPSDTLRDCYRRYREIERKLWAKEAVCSTS